MKNLKEIEQFMHQHLILKENSTLKKEIMGELHPSIKRKIIQLKRTRLELLGKIVNHNEEPYRN